MQLNLILYHVRNLLTSLNFIMAKIYIHISKRAKTLSTMKVHYLNFENDKI